MPTRCDARVGFAAVVSHTPCVRRHENVRKQRNARESRRFLAAVGSPMHAKAILGATRDEATPRMTVASYMVRRNLRSTWRSKVFLTGVVSNTIQKTQEYPSLKRKRQASRSPYMARGWHGQMVVDHNCHGRVETILLVRSDSASGTSRFIDTTRAPWRESHEPRVPLQLPRGTLSRPALLRALKHQKNKRTEVVLRLHFVTTALTNLVKC